MGIELKKNFDGYFTDVDYAQLVAGSKEMFDFLNSVHGLKDTKESLNFYNRFLTFCDNYLLINHPDSNSQCLKEFKLNPSQVPKQLWLNQEKSLRMYTFARDQKNNYNGTKYLIKSWHKIRNALFNQIKFEEIDLMTSKLKSATQEIIYNEKPFLDAYIYTLTEFVNSSHGKERITTLVQSGRLYNFSSWETYLDCFITTASSNVMHRDYPHKEGSILLYKMLLTKVTQLEKMQAA